MQSSFSTQAQGFYSRFSFLKLLVQDITSGLLHTSPSAQFPGITSCTFLLSVAISPLSDLLSLTNPPFQSLGYPMYMEQKSACVGASRKHQDILPLQYPWDSPTASALFYLSQLLWWWRSKLNSSHFPHPQQVKACGIHEPFQCKS